MEKIQPAGFCGFYMNTETQEMDVDLPYEFVLRTLVFAFLKLCLVLLLLCIINASHPRDLLMHFISIQEHSYQYVFCMVLFFYFTNFIIRNYEVQRVNDCVQLIIPINC